MAKVNLLLLFAPILETLADAGITFATVREVVGAKLLAICVAQGIAKTREGMAELRAAVMQNDIVLHSINEGSLGERQWYNLATAVQRCYWHGKPFYIGAVETEAKGGLPAIDYGDGKGKRGNKAGSNGKAPSKPVVTHGASPAAPAQPGTWQDLIDSSNRALWCLQRMEMNSKETKMAANARIALLDWAQKYLPGYKFVSPQ